MDVGLFLGEFTLSFRLCRRRRVLRSLGIGVGLRIGVDVVGGGGGGLWDGVERPKQVVDRIIRIQVRRNSSHPCCCCSGCGCSCCFCRWFLFGSSFCLLLCFHFRWSAYIRLVSIFYIYWFICSFVRIRC